MLETSNKSIKTIINANAMRSINFIKKSCILYILPPGIDYKNYKIYNNIVIVDSLKFG